MSAREVAGPELGGPRVAFETPERFSGGLSVQEVVFPGSPVQPVPFSASRFVVSPGGHTPPDTHSVAESWFVAAGQARLRYDGAEFVLEQGDIVVFAPDKTHQAFNDAAQDLLVFSTWWEADANR